MGSIKYNKFAPIVLFVYNRPIHVQKLISSLLCNEYIQYSDLIVYADGPKNSKDIDLVQQTRTYIKSISGFKSLRLIERSINCGLTMKYGMKFFLKRLYGTLFRKKGKPLFLLNIFRCESHRWLIQRALNLIAETK